ncbi:MAG: tRNA uridine-5-carboxymethylaminomethyl(34) synthesis GTPase MnmE [Peptostreptococcaceae bacterium]|jgi:tRNA modification GTPase|nr:tRNA uridine-5-carboxymethylaminomethyl(34) synthesis GTPase MnmE [Peptostreptococcaceae bacterium]
MNFIDDTICAIATPAGEGGIGIIRISGPDSLNIAKEVFRANKKIDEYSPRTLIYGHIYDGDKLIDEVLLAYMNNPRSYTGEDVIEINAHGGYMSVKKILELLLKKGARHAQNGEFTKRAFLNGRIDLSQAEAVMDVINAKTELSFESAQEQLEGRLSKKIKELRKKITELLAHVEVSIDFPEEDVEELTIKRLLDGIKYIKEQMQNLYDSAETGKILRDGLKTAIVGKPNVGKSSLLNALLRESRAIVTDIEGTTRDVIEEQLNINGILIKLIDTAGIRDTKDIVEQIGVEKSKEIISIADLIILVLDSSREITDEDMFILDNIKDKKAIILINKTDLEPKWNEDIIKEHVKEHVKIIKISASLNQGIKDLEDEITNMVFKGNVKGNNDLMITNTRHKDALYKAINSANDCINGIENDMPIDFVEIDLKNIWDLLGEVTGQTVSEDLLDTIFSEFCIGK